jgi:hypothetical protein
VRLATIDLDIEKGSLLLTDQDGKSASYHRVDGPFTLTALHAMCGPTGCLAMTPLLDAETFPDEVFVKHDSPQQLPQGPVGVIGKWAGDFRYVRDKE